MSKYIKIEELEEQVQEKIKQVGETKSKLFLEELELEELRFRMDSHINNVEEDRVKKQKRNKIQQAAKLLKDTREDILKINYEQMGETLGVRGISVKNYEDCLSCIPEGVLDIVIEINEKAGKNIKEYQEIPWVEIPE